MMEQKIIIDTNVICQADNISYGEMPTLLAKCTLECIRFLNNIIISSDFHVILDAGREILGEYERNVSSSQPTVANSFMRWLYSYIANMPVEDLINLTKNGDNTYEEYPADERLSNFDPPDKKFIALSNAHPCKPHIIQGTDCKWYGFKNIFAEHGIIIDFLCEDYIKDAYKKKMG